MNEDIEKYISNYSLEIRELFTQLRAIIYDSMLLDIHEKLWAKLPSYYAGDSFVRLIPFKDHINIEANAVASHIEELSNYKITPKGMLQIYIDQNIPSDLLKQIFAETLLVI